jgi:hypothetical protein
MPKISYVTKPWKPEWGRVPSSPPSLDRDEIQHFINAGKMEAYLQQLFAIGHTRFLGALCEQWLIVRERMFRVRRESWIDGIAPKAWSSVPKHGKQKLATLRYSRLMVIQKSLS